METIILISVLSTIGVVALVSSIVFAFIKLGKKVDDQDFITQSNILLEDIRNVEVEVDIRIKEESKISNDRFIEIYQALEKLESRLDSRSDKLHSLIKEVEKSIQKQVVL